MLEYSEDPNIHCSIPMYLRRWHLLLQRTVRQPTVYRQSLILICFRVGQVWREEEQRKIIMKAGGQVWYGTRYFFQAYKNLWLYCQYFSPWKDAPPHMGPTFWNSWMSLRLWGLQNAELRHECVVERVKTKSQVDPIIHHPGPTLVQCRERPEYQGGSSHDVLK